jgi:hypothetical protein
MTWSKKRRMLGGTKTGYYHVQTLIGSTRRIIGPYKSMEEATEAAKEEWVRVDPDDDFDSSVDGDDPFCKSVFLW